MIFLNKIIKDNINSIDEIVFFEFNGNVKTGDLQITNEFNNVFKNKIKTKIVSYSSNTESFCKELNECDFLETEIIKSDS